MRTLFTKIDGTTYPMSVDLLRSAAESAWRSQDRFATLDSGIRREMCEVLNCEPWKLDAALTDEVIEEILCG